MHSGFADAMSGASARARVKRRHVRDAHESAHADTTTRGLKIAAGPLCSSGESAAQRGLCPRRAATTSAIAFNCHEWSGIKPGAWHVTLIEDPPILIEREKTKSPYEESLPQYMHFSGCLVSCQPCLPGFNVWVAPLSRNLLKYFGWKKNLNFDLKFLSTNVYNIKEFLILW